MPNLKKNLSKYSIWACMLIAVVLILSLKGWNKDNKVIAADVVSYYAYLPATFIFHDIKLEHQETYDKGLFWPEPLPDGNKVIKTSMGMSVLYAPFFFVSHGIAKLMGWEAYGYSAVYKIGLLIGALFYFLIGLIYLMKILLLYFNDKIVALTIIAVTLGTNMLYYGTSEATVTHVYNFTLINIFVWLTIKWYKKINLPGLIVLGFLSGLITLIRPSNIIVLVLFFLYGVFSLPTLLERIKLVFSRFHWFLIMGAAFVIVWIPQFAYWWYVTGHFVIDSYPTERFFWGNPHFFDGMFSYRKGWLFYTPVMFFALIGIIRLFKKLKEFSWSITIFMILTMYIIFSWWCWWYGGSFGMRPFVDYYGLLAIPMALLFLEIWKYKKYSYIFVISIVLFSVVQNNFYMEKYKKNSIHWDSTTKASFWHSFWHLKPQSGYWELLQRPDYSKALEGIDAIEEEKK